MDDDGHDATESTTLTREFRCNKRRRMTTRDYSFMGLGITLATVAANPLPHIHPTQQRFLDLFTGTAMYILVVLQGDNRVTIA